MEGFKRVALNSQLKSSSIQSTEKTSTTDPLSALKIKKAWELAYSPAKNIPIQALMLWMSGNGVQIFSISITLMLLYNPLKSIFSLSSTFKPFKSGSSSSGQSSSSNQSNQTTNNLMWPMLVHVLFQLLYLLMGLWKCNSMGLIPSTESDWLAFLPQSHSLLQPIDSTHHILIKR